MIYHIFNESSLEELRKRRAALNKQSDETINNADKIINRNYEMIDRLRKARKNGTIADLDNLKESCEIALYAINEANFKFLPKFKDDPELKQYYKDIKEAKDLLEANGENVGDGKKVGICALRIIDIIYNIDSVASIPLMVFSPLVFIPWYLIDRLISWELRSWRESEIKGYARKVIAGYRKIMSNTENEELKQKCQEGIDKIQNRLDKEFD